MKVYDVSVVSLASAILLQIVPSLPQSESLKIVLCRTTLGNGGIYNGRGNFLTFAWLQAHVIRTV